DCWSALRPGARAEPLARAEGLLGPDFRVPARPSLPVLALGLGSVPRPWDPGLRRGQAGAGGAGRGVCRLRRGLSTSQGAGRARGVDRGRAARLPAPLDPLVLPLPPVVLPVRCALAPAPGAAGGSPAPGVEHGVR